MQAILNVFHNPIVIFTAVIIGCVVAFFIAAQIILIIRNYPTKSVSYKILYCDKILDQNSKVEENFQGFFESLTAKDITIAAIQIINSGNVIIKRKEHIKPITISFGENAQIISSEIKEESPPHLINSYQCLGNKIVIKSFVFKPGEYVTFKCLVNQLDAVSVEGKIIGIEQIRKFKNLFLEAGAVIYAVILAILGIIFFLKINDHSVLGLTLAILAAWGFIAALFFLSYSLFSLKSLPK